MKPVNRRRETMRAVGRLIDEFGADVLVQLDPPEELRPSRRLKLRIEAEDRVEFCTACDLHASRGGSTETPLTPFWSAWKLPRAGRIAVVTDAPTVQEHHAGELGHGPLWQTVRSELRGSGVDPADVTYLTSVACTPIIRADLGRGRTEIRRTPPSQEQAETCTANLLQSLAAADVDYIMLMGAHALRAWRRDLTIEQTAGHWFVWRDRWMVFPIEHPSVLMSQRRGLSATLWQQQFQKFALGVQGRAGLDYLSEGCIKLDCREAMYAYDDDGVPWCEGHFKANKATRDGRAVKLVDTTQQRLL